MKWMIHVAALAIGLSALPGSWAQAPDARAYPTKPVRLVVPYAAGGGGDAVFRLVTEPLAARLGQPLYFDYRAGAGGTIGLNLLSKAEADGYSLGVGSSDAVALAPNYHARLGYDPQKDLLPIAIVAEMPLVLLVKADSPIKGYKDLVKMAADKPGSVTYGTPGSGSASHIMGALLASGSGVEFTHIPYKGTAPAIQDLLGGQVTTIITSGFDAVPLDKAGRVRALAVSGTQRYALLPKTPTAREQGVDLVDELKVWFGVFAPAGVSKAIVGRLAREIDQIISTEQFKTRSAELGFVPIHTTPEQFQLRVQEDTTRLAALVRRTGVKPD